MMNRNRQRGMTAIGWMIIIALVALVVMLALKLFPLYLEHFSVTSSLDGLATDHDLVGAPPSALRTSLMRRFDINNVRNVHKEDVFIQRGGSGYQVNVDYEVRVPFVYNVDLVVTFSDTAEVPGR
jgi:Tfp pilus assembly protein FimT